VHQEMGRSGSCAEASNACLAASAQFSKMARLTDSSISHGTVLSAGDGVIVVRANGGALGILDGVVTISLH